MSPALLMDLLIDHVVYLFINLRVIILWPALSVQPVLTTVAIYGVEA